MVSCGQPNFGGVTDAKDHRKKALPQILQGADEMPEEGQVDGQDLQNNPNQARASLYVREQIRQALAVQVGG